MHISLASLLVIPLSAASLVAAADAADTASTALTAPTPFAPTPTVSTGRTGLNLTKIAKSLPRGLPLCGGMCTQTIGAKMCGPANVPCHCTNKDFIANFTACINEKCTDDDRLKIVTYENSICPRFNRSGEPQIIPVVPSTLPNRTTQTTGPGSHSRDLNGRGSGTTSGKVLAASSTEAKGFSLVAGTLGMVVMTLGTFI